ncbi:MAG: HAD family hydrolase [bacterium]|nr:HAD family hydrolase [bacterium]
MNKNSSINFKAVIFDLDGTLLDSLKGIADSMNGLLEQLGFPTHPMESYRYFIGSGIKVLIQKAMPGEWHRGFGREGSKEHEAAITELVAEFRKWYEVTWPRDTKAFEGIPQLLEELTAKGIKIAVLSNKADDFTKPMVSTTLPGFQFEMVLGGRPGVPRKPDPAAALEIIETLGVPPHETLFVGDSGIDMQTAVNSGTIPVGVLWGLRESDELQTNGAKHMIRKPNELLELQT